MSAESPVFSDSSAESKHQRLSVNVSAAVLIEDGEGRLLLVRQKDDGKWGPPAGGMEDGENVVGTALRECQEEIGVRVELSGLLLIQTVQKNHNLAGQGFVFRGRILPGQIINTPPEEITEFRYFTREEMRQLVAEGRLYKPEYNAVLIERWLAGQIGDGTSLEMILPIAF